MNSKHFLRLAGLVLGLAVSLPAAAPLSPLQGGRSAETVTDLTVTGSRSIAGDRVLAVVRQRRGEPLNSAVLNEDLKRIWKMGLFQEVNVDAQPSKDGKGVVVAFRVEERPLIQELRFFGNKDVSDGTLKDKTGLKEAETYDQDKVAAAVRAIETFYKDKNFYAVQVSVDTKAGKEAGQVVVNFRVSEGNKMKVEEIQVSGNKAFTASRIKGAMKDTSEAGWLSGGSYDPDKVFTDYELILRLYARNGYAKAKLDGVGLDQWGDKGREVVRNSTVFDEGQKRIILRFVMDEGSKYRLGKVGITGTSVYTEAQLKERMESLTDEVFNQDRWEADLARVRSAYSEKGYVYASIQPEYQYDETKGSVSVAIAVIEASKAYIEDIRIRGNEITKDKVIRRVLTIKPGDPFDADAVNRNRLKIVNLGFFENVVYDVQPGSEMDKLILIYDVSPERKTGTLSLGAGFSSVEGLVGFLQVSQNNLFGNGQAVSAQWDFGTNKQSYTLSFTEPYLLDKPISFGIDIFNIVRKNGYNNQGFEQTSTGGSLRLGYALNEDWKVFNTYRYSSDLTEHADPSLSIKNGVENISSITPSIVRDTRDNIFDTTKGTYNILSVTLAGGFLGGDKDYVKPVYDTRAFFTTPAILGMRWLNAFVLGLHGRVGYASPYNGQSGRQGDVPFNERFFVGGTDTVRGYQERSLGSNYTGGQFTLLGNVEYGFKPAPPLKIRAFYDTGNAWWVTDDAHLDKMGPNNPYMYASAGFGMLFTIPTSVIQIRLDYGWGLDSLSAAPFKDGKGLLHFNIGNIF